MISQLLIHPELQKREEQAVLILEKEGISRNHPNSLWLDEEKLGIEQVRKVKEFLSLKPYQGKSQAVVILQADNLTPEAQNAFLKTLEEPPGEAVVILGVTSEEKLLSTIISRCQVINLSNSATNTPDVLVKSPKDIEKLLGSTIEERFKFIEKLEDREDFLYALTAYFHQKFTATPERCTHKFLKDLLEAEKWAKQNVNIRAILEYLMLKIPSGQR